ncbi:MAG: type III ribulose-bisphosphate carboxylase [Candidatus Aenigmarchaeota archaeon]|nr:type III ribulose-bisphosphate carboxylase [Candidatus Aenigmarchaeota archaeon]
MIYQKYINLKYKPTKNDLVCVFKITPAKGVSKKRAIGAVAAESSTGTWTSLLTMPEKRMLKLGAKVFEIKGNYAKIAYPIELFEVGNISQLLSSIAGNIFGMKEIQSLRLEDIIFPKKYVSKFKGPELGLKDLRKYTGIKNKPLTGSIFKPKLGLTPKEQAKNAYKIYSNGIVFTKDDENLSSMQFNKFKERVLKMLEIVDKIKDEYGRNVIYAPNITAPYQTMIKRAQFVKDHGGKCVMIDFLTVGWSAFKEFRNQNFKMFIHLHRASHASFTRNKDHGISMLVLSKLVRLIGCTTLHTGTIFGKMEGSKQEIIEIDKFLRSKWFGLKQVMPVASGGLHPGLVPKLVNILGNDLLINFGGGLWGHPMGAEAGAKAISQAVNATIKNISLKDYTKTHKELRVAIDKWGN